METSIIEFNYGWIFIRHTPILKSRKTILCLHGLGDSSLSFLEAFQNAALKNFNIIALDLMGYGCSSDAPDQDYSFDAQIRQINRILEEFSISEFFLVGHSMGADIATSIVANDNGRVKGLINIEGNLTPEDVFLSKKAVNADRNGNFEEWFRRDFMNEIVLKNWATTWTSCKRYYASLWFCRPQAFLSNAHEICIRNSSISRGYETKTGFLFQQIKIPKVYCWGGKLSEQTKQLIEEKKITEWGFTDAFHWTMIDKEKEFYTLVSQFCSEE